MVLKGILYVLGALLLLLVLVLLLSLRLRITYADGVSLAVFVGGMRVYPVPAPVKKLLDLFPKKEGTDKSEESQKKKGKHRKKRQKPKTEKAKSPDAAKPEKRTEKSGISDYLDIILRAVKRLPKCFRVRLRSLSYTAGGEDAAKVALSYGTAYAVLESALAVLNGYSGVFYGFRANEKNIRVGCDFLSGKSTFSAETDISCFVWQLGSLAVRTAVEYILKELGVRS